MKELLNFIYTKLMNHIYFFRYLYMYRYNKKAKNSALGKMSTEISNSSQKHAAIILKNILRTSEVYFYILTNSFSDEIFNEQVFLEMEVALKRGVKIKFICLKPLIYIGYKILDNEDIINSFLTKVKLLSEKNHNFTLDLQYKLDDECDLLINKEEAGQKNFAIADDRMYWYQYDPIRFLAKANFNDPSFTNKIKTSYRL